MKCEELNLFIQFNNIFEYMKVETSSIFLLKYNDGQMKCKHNTVN